ncbi:hypothetical protein Pmani_018408 [Petrolisthes manimaculis]|uniref:Uncharacterized protein n=1 Tax=Petrolisthes manimaculis TaxID=1843537 RepID=A0AAE1PMH9_9EUCA|nr:hypothetical protein Pmani_018408 [Petrolisthes manimaculis]
MEKLRLLQKESQSPGRNKEKNVRKGERKGETRGERETEERKEKETQRERGRQRRRKGRPKREGEEKRWDILASAFNLHIVRVPVEVVAASGASRELSSPPNPVTIKVAGQLD